jgi:hypothetical protein
MVFSTESSRSSQPGSALTAAALYFLMRGAIVVDWVASRLMRVIDEEVLMLEDVLDADG